MMLGDTLQAIIKAMAFAMIVQRLDEAGNRNEGVVLDKHEVNVLLSGIGAMSKKINANKENQE